MNAKTFKLIVTRAREAKFVIRTNPSMLDVNKLSSYRGINKNITLDEKLNLVADSLYGTAPTIEISSSRIVLPKEYTEENVPINRAQLKKIQSPDARIPYITKLSEQIIEGAPPRFWAPWAKKVSSGYSVEEPYIIEHTRKFIERAMTTFAVGLDLFFEKGTTTKDLEAQLKSKQVFVTPLGIGELSSVLEQTKGLPYSTTVLYNILATFLTTKMQVDYETNGILQNISFKGSGSLKGNIVQNELNKFFSLLFSVFKKPFIHGEYKFVVVDYYTLLLMALWIKNKNVLNLARSSHFFAEVLSNALIHYYTTVSGDKFCLQDRPCICVWTNNPLYKNVLFINNFISLKDRRRNPAIIGKNAWELIKKNAEETAKIKGLTNKQWFDYEAFYCKGDFIDNDHTRAQSFRVIFNTQAYTVQNTR